MNQLPFKQLILKQFDEAKKYRLFMGGNISRECNGMTNLYIGDTDFHFGDECVNISAEIKHIYPNKEPKMLTFNQAREYACDVNTYDNIGRYRKRYLFEVHENHRDNKPYVIITEFNQWNPEFKNAIDFLNLKSSRMLYWEDQLTKFLLTGDKTIGARPRYGLRCVEYKTK